ncbi:Gfo/Idh/MocA family protein [Nocardia arthritidis]|uniref:Gfo/Idh/MocA family protein n=1 Tax=Nocardia arthritidis TaxID=228602 RepID=UPI00142D29F1|nr:Gfo/Idh/MocA family oxidoreductase [Nocardia arthritidis]
MTHVHPPGSAIGVGIVGLSAFGGWAAEAHVPALQKLPGFELRALAASSVASAKSAGEKFGVGLTFDNVEELAQRDEVDLVVVSVQVREHRSLVLSALGAKKMVLCEWPLGVDLAEAEEIAADAAATGVRTFIGLQARSAPAVRYLRDLIRDGYVGEVLSTSVIASTMLWGRTFDRKNAYILDRNGGATMLTVPFGHTIDGLTSVLGEFTECTATTATRRGRVFDKHSGEPAVMTAEDQIAVTGTLNGGAVASIHFRGGHTRGTNFLWEINGTHGDLRVTGQTGHLGLGQFKIYGGRLGDTAVTELPVPVEYKLPQFIGDREQNAYAVAHQYAAILSDIVDNTRLAPDFAHGVDRHRLIDSVRRAAESGRRQIIQIG